MFSKWCAVKEVANVCQKVFFKYESYQWGRNPILQLSFLIERDAKKKKRAAEQQPSVHQPQFVWLTPFYFMLSHLEK